MKNNIITFPQYCFSVFLSTLSVLLFVDYNPSIVFYSLIVVSLVVDIITVNFYKSDNVFLKIFSVIYLFFLSVTVCTEFCRYLYYDLGYGQLWLLVVIIIGFSFFCTVKGLEPVSRAAVIIFVFVIVSLVLIAVSSFNNIKPHFNLFGINSITIPLILLFPSAIYILNRSNIINEKKYIFSFFSFMMLCILIYCHMLPKNKVAVGIIKGADGALLAVLTVSVIYFLSVSTVAVCKKIKHQILFNGLFLFLTGAVSVLILYFVC